MEYGEIVCSSFLKSSVKNKDEQFERWQKLNFAPWKRLEIEVKKEKIELSW